MTCHPDPFFDIAMLELMAQKNSVKTAEILKKKGGPEEKIKEELRIARKSQMRTVQHYLCDHCDALIANPQEGFVIHGNIYLADPTETKGMIGNNFPDTSPFELNAVKKTVFCNRCLMDALGLGRGGSAGVRATSFEDPPF